MPRSAHHFSVERDVPDLSGFVCLVTGANAGLGKQTVLELAKHNPSEIYLTARSASKAKEAINEIQLAVPKSRITFLQLDLDNLHYVPPPGLTTDGYEVQFGTNHVAHALLTKLLLPILDKAPNPRVVILSSDLWSQAPPEGIKFETLKTTQEDISTFARYGQSKLANIIYGLALARNHPNLTVASVHPGIYKKGLQTAMSEQNAMIRMGRKSFGGLVLGDPAKGTRNQLWAATSKHVTSGEYYTPVGAPGKAKKFTDNRDLVERLWVWTEKELEGYKIDDLD